jgi:hypothetical protein
MRRASSPALAKPHLTARIFFRIIAAATLRLRLEKFGRRWANH